MDPIRIVFEKGEVGWAEPLGEHLARIDNIPYSGDYNLDDVVELGREDEGGRPTVVKLVARRYKVRKAIYYDDHYQFWRLQAVIRVIGGEAEGATGPENGHRGMMVVACHEKVDPVKLAEALGIEDPERVE